MSSGELAIHNHLGEDAVCTLLSTCPDDADYSPVSPASVLCGMTIRRAFLTGEAQ